MFFSDPFRRRDEAGDGGAWRSRARLACALVAAGLGVGFFCEGRYLPAAAESFMPVVVFVLLVAIVLMYVL